MARISKQKQRLRSIANSRFNNLKAPTDPGHSSSLTIESPIGTEGQVTYTLESGSEGTAGHDRDGNKRKLDIMEYNHSSPKRQALQLSQEPLMPQIRPPPKVANQFNDSDVLDLYSSDSDESYESDVSSNSEIDTDDEALFNTRNDAGDQSIVELKWHPDGGKSLRQRYGSGSRATEYRQKKRRAGLQREASEHYSIKELFKRQEVVNLNRGKCNDAPEVVPLSMIAHGRSAGELRLHAGWPAAERSSSSCAC